MGAVANMLASEASGLKRQQNTQDQVRRLFDEALDSVIVNADSDTALKNSIASAFEALSRRIIEITTEIASAEEEAAREKAKTRTAMFEARLETNRKASTVQMKQQEVELNAKTEMKLADQRYQLLEGTDDQLSQVLAENKTLSAEVANRGFEIERLKAEQEEAANTLSASEEHVASLTAQGERCCRAASSMHSARAVGRALAVPRTLRVILSLTGGLHFPPPRS
jgi:hypothetical protein